MGLREKLQKGLEAEQAKAGAAAAENELNAKLFQDYDALTDLVFHELMAGQREQFNRNSRNYYASAFTSDGRYRIHTLSHSIILPLVNTDGSQDIVAEVRAEEVWSGRYVSGPWIPGIGRTGSITDYKPTGCARSIGTVFRNSEGAVILEESCEIPTQTLLSPEYTDAQKGAAIYGDVGSVWETIEAISTGSLPAELQDA